MQQESKRNSIPTGVGEALSTHRPGVGVFGTGALARRLIADLRRQDYIVLAVWGSTRAAAEKLAFELKVPFYSHREDDVVLREGVELIVLACAPHFQWQIATNTLKAGRNVLLVPPFATTCSEIAQVAEQAITYRRLISAVLQPLRYTKAFRIVRSILQFGESNSAQQSPATSSQPSSGSERASDASVGGFSDIERLTRGVRVRGGKLTSATANLGRLCVVDVQAQSDLARRRERFGWPCDWKMAGGALASLGACVIDILRYVTGSRCSAVRGFATTCRVRTARIGGIREISADDFCAFQARIERESRGATTRSASTFVNVTLNGLWAFTDAGVGTCSNGTSEEKQSGDAFQRPSAKPAIECLLVDGDEADSDGQLPRAVVTFVFVCESGTLTVDTQSAQVILESFATGRRVVIDTTVSEDETTSQEVSDADTDNASDAPETTCDSNTAPQVCASTDQTDATTVPESEGADERSGGEQSTDSTFERRSAPRLSVRNREARKDVRKLLATLESQTDTSADNDTETDTDGVLEQLRLIRECLRAQKEQRSTSSGNSVMDDTVSRSEDRLSINSARRRTVETIIPINGTPFAELPHVDEWFDVQSVIDGVRESSRTGAWCNVMPQGHPAVATAVSRSGSSVTPSVSSFQLQPASTFSGQSATSSSLLFPGNATTQQSTKLQSSVNEKHHASKKTSNRP